jgi:NAD(P)-dependent dehydrogenase (short-subunit alcohol dehydrogenase family)
LTVSRGVLGWPGLATLAVGVIVARSMVRRARRMDLDGATVLVTGGSRGLGLVLAREFGRQGARVAICARDPDALARARADLVGRGVQVVAVVCDVTRREEVDALVRRVVDDLGSIDVLVNNAGVIDVGPVETMTLDDYERAMATNFWGALHTTLAVLPGMRRRGRGRVVNVTSIGGKVAAPHLLPYTASKFALVGLSQGLRGELCREGILVTTVCPGLMRTGSPRNAGFKGQHRAEYAWFALGDSLPGISMDAERAARQIVAACRDGDAEVVLSMPARIVALAQGLAPGVMAEALCLVNRLLPAADGGGTRRARGHESESALAPSWLTALGDEAARRYNQLPPRAPAGE